jgi:chromate transporter
MSSKSLDLFRKVEFNFILGKPAIYLLLILLFGMWIYYSIYTTANYLYFFGFYSISCLIIGPIEVVLAYFMSILPSFGHLNPEQIWIGIPVAFLLPGTHLNVGIFFGAMIDGVRGAILSAIALFLPSFLSLYGLLPQWVDYRDRQGIKRLYEGLVCSTTGLILAMVKK